MTMFSPSRSSSLETRTAAVVASPHSVFDGAETRSQEFLSGPPPSCHRVTPAASINGRTDDGAATFDGGAGLAPVMNGGVVVKSNGNQRYATVASDGGFLARELGRRAGLSLQEFAVSFLRPTD